MFGYWLEIVFKITLGQLVNENLEKLFTVLAMKELYKEIKINNFR